VDFESEGLGAVSDGFEDRYQATLTGGYRRTLGWKLAEHHRMRHEQVVEERREKQQRPWYERILRTSPQRAPGSTPLNATKPPLEEEEEPRFKFNSTIFLLVLGVVAGTLEFAIDTVGKQLTEARSYIPNLKLPYAERIIIFILCTLVIFQFASSLTHWLGGVARGSGIPVS
jgi:hypothetical protein